MNDQQIVCCDCSREFVFTVAEQEFFYQKGFTNPPRRCKDCRTAAKQNRGGGGRQGGGGSYSSERQLFDAVCSACGVATQVPFRPSGAKPVYCRDCFRRV